MVLQQLWENNLYLKPKKCEFNKTTMEYLGLIIKEGQLSMDPVKLKGISEWPVPTTVKQVRAFLGFGNFYQRFIRKFSELALPLNNLLKKDMQFDWTPACQESPDTLKKRFTEEPVLMMPDYSRTFQIESDASKYASGAVLTQMDSNRDRHPVLQTLFFFDTRWPCFLLFSFIYDLHAPSSRLTCLYTRTYLISYFMFYMCLPQGEHQFFTYLKPVVRRLYSLAFH